MVIHKKLKVLKHVAVVRKDQQESTQIEKPISEMAVSGSEVINADEIAASLQLVGIPYSQWIVPNPSISCNPGLCLVYVRETFNIGPKYPTARTGWESSMYKHENKRFPPDVWVPIWFLVSDNAAGHVALRQPDGTVWSASHPTDASPIHHESIEDLERYYSGRLHYLGWTEDIEGVQVVGRK